MEYTNIYIYILSIFLDSMLVILLFSYIDGKFVNFFYVFILFFFGIFLGNGADFILLLFVSLIEKKDKKIELLNSLLLSLVIFFIASILAASILMQFVFENDLLYVIFKTILSILLILLITIIYNLIVKSTINEQKKSKTLMLFLINMYIILIFFMYSVQYYKAYDKFIIGILLFVVVQLIFTYQLFLRDQKKRQKNYENQLFRNQLDNLKKYTQNLEEDYQSIRKFRHDYKNMLLSLRINVENKEYDEITHFLDNLSDYSDSYFQNSTMDVFMDLSNIQNEYLKSIFINKLQDILKLKLNGQFECYDIVKDVNMDIFDAIRMISITLDNAIEAAEDSIEKKINIALLDTESEFMLKVENTFNDNQEILSKLMLAGYSSKNNHLGLGLSNIQEIKKKYPNVFVQYEKEKNWFFVKIMISKGE